MSNSFRKRPYAAHVGNSQKKGKQCCNRCLRRRNHMLLSSRGEDAVFIVQDEALDKWAMSQDGSRGYRPYSKYAQRMSYRRWYRWAKAK